MTTPRQRIAVIKGVFAKPGVSKNRRWYKPEHIADAVTEAQQLIDSGDAPTVFSMLTSHGARDAITGDVTNTAGRLTKVGVNAQGWGTYEAELADTQAGRDVAALTTPEHPYLKGVSMASQWKGIPRRVIGPDNQPCETAEGFSLRGIDFTHNPGITGAEITSAELVESAPGALILESLDEEDTLLTTTEETIEEAASVFADPGYHGDKGLEITTPDQIRGAWATSHTKSVVESYTPKQIQRIRSKVKSAAQKAGFDIVAETALLGTEIMEAYTSVCVDNGPADLRVSAYIDDPAKLQAVTQRVAIAALAALHSLDPDNDGDIDLGITEDDDDEMSPCPACSALVAPGANFCPACGQPVPSTEAAPTEKEPTVADTNTTESAATESTLTISESDLQAKIDAGIAAALEAAAKPVEESAELIAARALIAEADGASAATETAPVAKPAETTAVAESDALSKDDAKAMITEALEAQRAQFVEEYRSTGGRKGLVPKHILEQGPEDVYGEGADLSKASGQDLEKFTDAAFSPLLGR